MSSFLFQREQIHCNCFDSSPKNAPRIFRTDSQYSNKNSNKQPKQASGRNVSEQGKHKKKSLKKERQHSNVGSEKDVKEREDPHCEILIPDFQTAFSCNQTKKQPRIMGYEPLIQPAWMQIKTQRNKPAHNIRQQRPNVFYQPMHFQTNYKLSQQIPAQIHSEKIIVDQRDYDKKITEEFQKDFRDFKLQMDMIEAQKQLSQLNLKKRKQQKPSLKVTAQQIDKKPSQHQIRYPVTEHIIPVVQNEKVQHRVASFRGSAVSNKEKGSTKNRDKILPKQIQSEKGSSSQSQSDKESVFLGRGFDGLTQKRDSFEEIEKEGKRNDFNIQTMVTEASHIKNSNINTLTDYSHTITSPKSLYGKGITAFGGSHKYGVAGMSYQHIGQIKRPKLASSSKINF